VAEIRGEIFPTPPSPEIPLFAVGFPPLMLIEFEPVPEPLPLVPPRLVASPPAPPLLLGGLPLAPLGTPGCLPSGEIEMRAARLPCGGCTGAAGPGVADSAMNVEPPLCADCDCASSGAGPTSPACACSACRGAAPAFNSSLGRAGAFVGVVSESSPGF